MKVNPIIYITIGIAVLAGLFFVFKPKTNQQSIPPIQQTNQNTGQQTNGKTVTVSMKSSKFDPETITVQKGTKVIFKNEDTQDRWPASNIHPTHTIYPEFDPKAPITAGQEWSFVFDKVGDWKYHDHLMPSTRGEILVVEGAVDNSIVDSAQRTYELVIKGKKIVSGPETIQVVQGDEVTIKITSDEAEEFHVHGYDKSVELQPNQQATLTFRANISGRFDFELEQSKMDLGALEVQPK